MTTRSPRPPAIAAAALGALAGAAASLAQPAETELRYESRIFNLSHNNGWATSITALPGDHIEVRAVVSFVGTTQVYGLGQMIFQPVVSNWSLDDSVIGTPGTPGNRGIGPVGGAFTTPRGYVPDEPGVYGRISPFGYLLTTSSNYYRGHVHIRPEGTFLRIARNDITNWIGVGASSGSGAANNTSGVGGVGLAQGDIGVGRDTRLPPENTSASNVVVFKFGFVLSSASTPRVLTVTTPPLGIGRSTLSSDYGAPNIRWYGSANHSFPGAYRSDAYVVDSTISVVPAPATVAGWSVLFAGAIHRRRIRC